MGQLYCFSCGRLLNDAEAEKAVAGGPVPICDSCKAAGPAVAPEDVRWMVRRAEERPQGPLSREAVTERLARETIGPYDQVCRVNGEWQRLVEHPDFRASFIPGTPDAVAVAKLKTQLASDRSQESSRKRRQLGGALALLVVGVGLPVFTVTTGSAVLPESWVNSITSLWGRGFGRARTVVSSAASEGEAHKTVQRNAGLPAKNAIARLQNAYPHVEEPVELLLARGEAGLWRGTSAGLDEARDSFEKAVAAAPDDADAVSGLALAYAALLHSEDGQIATVADLVERTEMIAPGSVASLRAQSALGIITGDLEKAARMATTCLGPAAAPATPGAAPEAAPPVPPAPPAEATPPAAPKATGDLVCQGFLAYASGDSAALDDLEQRYASVVPFTIARGLVALHGKEWGRALKVGRALSRRTREDGAGWVLLTEAAAALGMWKEAGDAAVHAGELAPWRLDLRALHGDILLKVNGQPDAALTVLEKVIADGRWKEFKGQEGVLVAAGQAALQTGKKERALELADQALALDRANISAVLLKAQVLAASGRDNEVEPLVAAIDINRLQGREGARYLVGVARIHLAAKRNKAASVALDAALDLYPRWSVAHLERARAWLVSGNPSAAVEQLGKLARVDISLEDGLSPLTQVWYPRASWGDTYKSLQQQASEDVRLAPDSPGAIGVLAWAAGMGEARGQLQHALELNPNALEAHAALAWLLLERGEAGAALTHIDRVLAADPQLGLFHGLRGRALTVLGRLDDAQTSFAQATVNAAREPSLYLWRADARRRAGDLTGAEADLREVLKLVPEHLEAQARLVDLHQDRK